MNRGTNAGYQVFVSYSTKDQAAADEARAAIEQRGLRCWMAPRDIRPGVEWVAAVPRS